MTAQVLEFRPRGRGPAPLIVTKLPQLTIVDSAPWWTCPPFCSPDRCVGGQTFNNGGVTNRLHIGEIYTEDVRSVDGFTTTATVEVHLDECAERGYTGPPVVVTNLGQLDTTDLDAVRRVAVALESAAWHAAQPLHSRSASEGVGRATNLEAS